MFSGSSIAKDAGERDGLLAAALETIITRRFAGEDVPDESAQASWPHLMPELGERLAELRKVEHARRAASAAPPPAIRLPGYDIAGEIHRGGQGVVYRAMQRSTGRTVAIKVLREGPFAGPRDRARFEREVQILAQLSHPHIVVIHDSGVAAEHAYLVMDLVDGVPLDDFVSRAGWPLERTLTLFAEICDAVNAAHLRGVIHRDLKPSNILVSETRPQRSGDGAATLRGTSSSTARPAVAAAAIPKILDFGLAKVTETEGTPWRTSSMTESGAFVGSLPWASPEQAEGRSDRIDVRTDVYSLGVLLYQCITGAFPYEVTDSLPAVLRRIVETEPPRPSTHRPLDDDIDTIVLRCLAKSPERRYQSAGELARDLRHYLAREPIEAKRDDAWYVLRKVLRRHRAAVAVAAAFVLLIAGSSVALWRLYQTAAARAQLAQQQQGRAETAEQQALARQREAEVEAARAKDYHGFMQKLLARVQPAEALGRDVTLREFLDETAQRPERELASRPEVQGAILDTVGTTYAALSLYGPAEQALRRALDLRRAALGDEHPDAVTSRHNLGAVLRLAGQLAEAAEVQQAALAAAEALPEAAKPLVAACLEELAELARQREALDEAERLARRALALRREQPGGELELAASLHVLAGVLKDQRDAQGARAAYAEAREIQAARLPPEHPDLAATLNNLGELLAAMDDFAGAAELLQAALATRTRVLAPAHVDRLATLNNLAHLRARQGDLDAAASTFREVIDACRATQSADHPYLSGALFNIAEVLASAGQPADAEPLYREALELDRRRAGDRPSQIGDDAFGLATVLFEQGRYADAEPLFREALERARPSNDPVTLSFRCDRLATTVQYLGRADEAAPLFREAVALARTLPGESRAVLTNRLNNLALLLKQRGDYAEADALYSEALAARRALLPAGDPLIASSLHNLGMLRLEEQRPAEAEPLLREALDIRRAFYGPAHADVALSLNGLALLLHERGDYPSARELFQQAIAMREAALPPQHSETLRSMAFLAESLLAEGDNAAAVELHRRVLERRTAALGPEHPDTLSSLRCLGTALAAAGDAAQAEKLLRHALDLARADLPNHQAAVWSGCVALGRFLTDEQRFDEAEPLLREAVEGLRERYAASHVQVRKAVAALVELYERWGRPDDAAKWRAP